MTRRFKVAVLSLACLTVVLSARLSLGWYLKRGDQKLKKQLETLSVVEEQPSFLQVRMPFPLDLLPVLRTPETFRIAHRVSDIPLSVESAFARATQKSSGEDVFSMAEPGSWPWNVGDALIDGLPRRRLKSVATTESFCLLFYEHGGFGKSDDVAVFRLSGSEAHAIWHSYLAPDVTKPAELLDAVSTRPYGDERY